MFFRHEATEMYCYKLS